MILAFTKKNYGHRKFWEEKCPEKKFYTIDKKFWKCLELRKNNHVKKTSIPNFIQKNIMLEDPTPL